MPYGTVAHDDPAVVAVLETMRDRGVILDPTITLMALLSEEARAWAVNLTRSAHEMGIRICTGTDAALLFDEIEALVNEVGLNPLEALASATSVGAAGIGVDGDFGSLEVGKVADVVVYPADPSVDITALRRPSHVIRSGNLVRPRHLAWLVRRCARGRITTYQAPVCQERVSLPSGTAEQRHEEGVGGSSRLWLHF